jgi:hypothetical protein
MTCADGGSSRTIRRYETSVTGADVGPGVVEDERAVRRGRGISVALALSALALLGASCGGDDAEDSGSEPAEAGEGPTTTTQESLEEEIVDAYEQSWRDFIRAGNPPDPEAEVLTEHNTGDALTTSRNMLNEYVAEGVVLRGTYEFDAEVVELGDGTATVEDCGLNQLEEVLADSGEVVEPFDDERDGIVADLVLEEDAWKVTTLADNEEVCAGA